MQMYVTGISRRGRPQNFIKNPQIVAGECFFLISWPVD